MKKLTCEMCGGTDLVKKDGVYVCSHCGVKYSVEEARKMMIEGTVDVSGSTVKVDASEELSNLYQIARRAKDENNSENAAKYYDMILVKDPASWEAAFYTIYYKAMGCVIAQIRASAISVSNCLENVFTLIRDNESEEKQAGAVNEVVLRCKIIANLLADGAKGHYDGIDASIKNKYTQEYVNNACAARDILYNCGTQVDRIFSDRPEIGKACVDAWKAAILMHTKQLPYMADEKSNKKMMISYAEKIGKYDPDFSKDYVYDQKKNILEAEISDLEKKINNAQNAKVSSKGTTMAFGVVFLILGIIFVLFGSRQSSGLLIGIGIFEIIMGALFATVSAKAGRSAKDIAEDKSKRIASLNDELKDKKAELAALKK